MNQSDRRSRACERMQELTSLAASENIAHVQAIHQHSHYAYTADRITATAQVDVV